MTRNYPQGNPNLNISIKYLTDLGTECHYANTLDPGRR